MSLDQSERNRLNSKCSLNFVQFSVEAHSDVAVHYNLVGFIVWSLGEKKKTIFANATLILTGL